MTARAAPIREAWAAAALILALVAIGWCEAARAHQINLSNARITIHADRTVDVEIAMKGSDVDRAAATKLTDDRTGLVRPDALARAAATVAGYVATHAVVLGKHGSPCRPGVGAVAADGDGVVVRTRWSCAGLGGKLRYRSTALIDVAPDARQVVLIASGGALAQDLLDVSRIEIGLLDAPKPPMLGLIERYGAAGVEKVFIGYDHIAFLIAIVLWARQLRPVAGIVAAFTIACSVTLWLATLGVLRIPGAVVQPAIAASIVWVAVENFLSRRLRNRWRAAFAFGLVHGLGYAAALQDVGMPRGALVPALASFNVGVGIGQVAIVSLVLPALLALDRLFAVPSATAPSRPPLAVYTISAEIVGLGSYWFLARTVLRV